MHNITNNNNDSACGTAIRSLEIRTMTAQVIIMKYNDSTNTSFPLSPFFPWMQSLMYGNGCIKDIRIITTFSPFFLTAVPYVWKRLDALKEKRKNYTLCSFFHLSSVPQVWKEGEGIKDRRVTLVLTSMTMLQVYVRQWGVAGAVWPVSEGGRLQQGCLLYGGTYPVQPTQPPLPHTICWD